MEDEKKKKRQKKKKNKQTKTTESIPSDVGAQAYENNNHVNSTEQLQPNQDSKTADVQIEGLQKSDVGSDRQPIHGTESASLERKIKELQEELDAHMQREADLEKNMLQLQDERNSWLRKEAELETRVIRLQAEIDSCLEKVAGYEEKINQFVDEAAALRSREVSLEEKIVQMEQEKDSLAQKESSAVETVASLNKDNARLRAQVIELEATRNDMFHQNQQLKEHVSNLQSKIQNLENSVSAHLSSEKTMHVTEKEDTNLELGAARALVDKLLSENEKLVEKVNNLNAELDHRGLTTESSLPTGQDDPTVTSSKAALVADSSAPRTELMIDSAKIAGNAESSAPGADQISSASESQEDVRYMVPMSRSSEGLLSDKILESLKDEARFKSNGVHYITHGGSETIPSSRGSMDSGEIVQIPLDENEVTLPESKPPPVPEPADVPLTDAPLIGAPFRLISFVARYVSGADLVKKG